MFSHFHGIRFMSTDADKNGESLSFGNMIGRRLWAGRASWRYPWLLATIRSSTGFDRTKHGAFLKVSRSESLSDGRLFGSRSQLSLQKIGSPRPIKSRSNYYGVG